MHHTNLVNLGYADPPAYHPWRGGFDRNMLLAAAAPARRGGRGDGRGTASGAPLLGRYKSL
jgi:hypothetical protein